MKKIKKYLWLIFAIIAIVVFIYLFNFNDFTVDTNEGTIKILFFVGNLSTFISAIAFYYR
jgi:hypothetical protein